MPYAIVGFESQMPLFKDSRRRLLSSLIKLLYKNGNTCLVTLYMMMPFLPDLNYYEKSTLFESIKDNLKLN